MQYWGNILKGLVTVLAICFGMMVVVNGLAVFNGVGGKLDKDCAPNLAVVLVSVAAPEFFWREQERYYEQRAARNLSPPSQKFREVVAAPGAKNEARSSAVGPTQARIDALRTEADRLEFESSMQGMDASAARSHQRARARAQSCLLRAKAALGT